MRELHVDSICKWFGQTQILSDIFLSCKPGEIIGLLGRNGSGKTTLLKIIFGAVEAQTKFVRVNGSVINSLVQSKNKIAYLPQNNFLPSHLNIKNAITLFSAASTSRVLQENHFIKPFLNRKSRELSGGERRMIETLVVVNSPAEYILIDEPFNGVEPLYKEEIKKTIQSHASDKGFIVTDHDYRNIVAISTKVKLLQHGGIKEIKNVDDLVRLNYLPEL
ncbi:MAG TPA: ATP-binding cassette domain-containing protein [Chryseolinea sp.]